MNFKIITFLIFSIINSGLYSVNCQTTNTSVEMRKFLISIGNYTRLLNPKFILVGKGNIETILNNDKLHPVHAKVDTNFLKHINGWLLENLFYGMAGDNITTHPHFTNLFLSYLTLAKTSGGEKIFVLDYTTNQSRINDSYTKSQQYGFLSFATSSKLDSIPIYPKIPFNSNNNSIENFSQAQNFLVIFNYANFASKQAFINKTKVLNHDVFFINPYFSRGLLFNKTELGMLKVKPDGGIRKVICQLPVSEVTNTSSIWLSTWKPCSDFISLDNKKNPNLFKTKYWTKGWQDIVSGNNKSEAWKLVNAGCDGALLDGIDYKYWSSGRPC